MNINKFLIFAGFGLIIIGLIGFALSKIGLNPGKLPGDLHIVKEKYGIYFPIITSIVLSIVLTIILNAIFWMLKK